MDQVTEDQQHVWEILSNPWIDTTFWGQFDAVALRKLVDEIKTVMIKEYPNAIR